MLHLMQGIGARVSWGMHKVRHTQGGISWDASFCPYTPRTIFPTATRLPSSRRRAGTIRVQLAGKDAPVTAGNFIELAARGFYDKLKFHAHKPGSVVLGG